MKKILLLTFLLSLFLNANVIGVIQKVYGGEGMVFVELKKENGEIKTFEGGLNIDNLKKGMKVKLILEQVDKDFYMIENAIILEKGN